MSRLKYCTDCRHFKIDTLTAPTTEFSKNPTNALVMGKTRLVFWCRRPGMEYTLAACLLERSYVDDSHRKDTWDHCGSVGRYFEVKQPLPQKKPEVMTFLKDE